MCDVNPFVILGYIRSVFDILESNILKKVESEKSFEYNMNYEELLQQMESESREHIGVVLNY